jgi:drug/metabolite transporter (DMT)-like permease
MSAAEIGLWLGIAMALLAAIGSAIGGMIIDRLSRSGVRAAPFYVAIGAGLVGGPLLSVAHILDNRTTVLALLSAGLMIFGAIAAACFGSIQVIAAPTARGKVASLVTVAGALLAQGTAPVLVALITDYVFHDNLQIGRSLAVVEALLCLIGISAFAMGLSPLKKITQMQPSVGAGSSLPPGSDTAANS